MSAMKITRRGTPYTPFGSGIARELDDFRNRTRQLFDEPFSRFISGMVSPAGAEVVGWYPAAEVAENASEFTVSVELAGMKAEDVTVDFNDGMLTVRGEKTAEREEKDEEQRYHVWERSYGSFLRSFEFPSSVDTDKVNADFSDGVLKVHLPKRTGSMQNGRRIPVSATAAGGKAQVGGTAGGGKAQAEGPRAGERTPMPGPSGGGAASR